MRLVPNRRVRRDRCCNQVSDSLSSRPGQRPKCAAGDTTSRSLVGEPGLLLTRRTRFQKGGGNNPDAGGNSATRKCNERHRYAVLLLRSSVFVVALWR